MKLSIALCSYNGEKHIAEQIMSFEAQERKPDELVICDDQSDDATIQIIHSKMPLCSFPIRLIQNSQRLGLAKNFEQAIRECSGDVIFLSDQDDRWKPQKMAVVEKVFQANSDNLAAVFSDAELVDEELNDLEASLWQRNKFTEDEKASVRRGDSYSVFLRHNVAAGVTIAFRSQYRDRVFPIPENWIHDHWIMLLLSVDKEIQMIEDCLVDYRQHSSQSLGASKKRSVLRRALDARSKGLTECQEILDRFRVAHTKLKSLPELSQQKLFEIEKKVKHFEFRNQLSEIRIFRLLPIMRSVQCGDYDKYSAGISSAIRDVLRKRIRLS